MFNFDHTTKWCMHKPESILENERLKILKDFKIQMDYVIPARKPSLVFISNKKRGLVAQQILPFKGIRRIWNSMKNRDHQDDRIVEKGHKWVLES